ALLLTSRFTTVLQHSTRDAADALARLGWETRVLIEPSSHHHMPSRGVRGAVLEFRPDVVITIDHLRRDRPGIIPPALPFICWIQDNLANLTNRDAGASITARDFILTCSQPQYTRDFGYPARQCVYLQKLTRVPPRPAAWTSDGDDLAFVSN